VLQMAPPQHSHFLAVRAHPARYDLQPMCHPLLRGKCYFFQ
jgi:hypothetical protein